MRPNNIYSKDILENNNLINIKDDLYPKMGEIVYGLYVSYEAISGNQIRSNFNYFVRINLEKMMRDTYNNIDLLFKDKGPEYFGLVNTLIDELIHNCDKTKAYLRDKGVII